MPLPIVRQMRLEDAGRAGEVDAGELRARERRVAHLGARAEDEVDHAGRQARLLEQPHRVPGRQRLRRGRLPDDRVSHQRRRRRQVGADRGEVERADREHEALERPVLHPVPDARRRDRLLLVDPHEVLGVEAEEVDRLAGGVDLRLVRGLRLVEHRRRVDRRAPRAGRSARRRAGRRRPARATASATRLGWAARAAAIARSTSARAALLDVGEHVVAPVRHHRLERRPRLDPLAADHHRDVDRSAAICASRAWSSARSGEPGRVALDRLVDRGGRPEDAGGAHRGDCIVVAVRVTRHLYDVPGWGVGEVWLRDGVLVQHELPSESLRAELDAAALASGHGPADACRRPASAGPAVPQRGSEAPSTNASGRSAPVRADSCRICAGGSRAPRRRSRRPTTTSRSTSTGRRRSSGSSPRRPARSRGARSSPTASSPRSPGGPGAARAAGSFCADNRFSLVIPCHRVVAANGIGGYGSAGLRAEAAAARARGGRPVSAGSLAEDVRAELAAIAPTRRCDRLAEISALFHTAGSVHLRGRGAIAFHLDLGSSAIARRAFALLADLRVPAEIRTYSRALVRPRHALPAPRRRRSATRSRSLAEAGVLDGDHRPLDRPPGPRRRAARAAAAPTCAAPSSAAARSRARARRTSRSGRRRSPAPRSCAASPRRRRCG